MVYTLFHNKIYNFKNNLRFVTKLYLMILLAMIVTVIVMLLLLLMAVTIQNILGSTETPNSSVAYNMIYFISNTRLIFKERHEF
jgi:uncharacterized BrkB/YihY/UPF0761 family membrane protein